MYEIVVETEYQDIYRLKYGVLLVVDKFKTDEKYKNKYFYSRYIKCGQYHKNTQNGLVVTKEDYYDTYSNTMLPKGTIMFCDIPVISCDNEDYFYKIKTTGDSFSGDMIGFKEILDSINKIANNKLKGENT